MDRNPLPPGRTSLDDYKSILDARLFNTPKWYVGRLGREKRIDMRIGPEITKSVVFLGRRTNNGGLYLGGTAFVVRVPHGKGNYDYLVTARHNIIALRGEQMIVRVNTTDGRFKTIDMGVDPKWWCHPSEERSVDVSVVPFSTTALRGKSGW
jgi:hypothetical protein